MDSSFCEIIKKRLEEIENYETIVINTIGEYKAQLKNEFPAYCINPGQKIEQSTEIRITKSECSIINFSLFIYGLYIKKERFVSQTPMPNVPNAVSDIFKDFVSFYDADSFKFVGAGREDVDTINVLGRPFYVEFKNPKKNIFTPIPPSFRENKFVALKDLMRVNGSKIKKIILEGERSHKKSYTAIVFCGKPQSPNELFGKTENSDDDFWTSDELKFGSLINTKYEILQKTPLRVLHRRANLVRRREIKITKIEETRPYLRFSMQSTAGTYIKKFVTGDLGRTTPSVASLLNCSCDCIELNVLEIEAINVPEDCIYERM